MTGAASLRALVLQRRRRWLAWRGVESALIGGGVAAVTLSAARLSGADLSRQALAVAALCGALAGLSLMRERWRDEPVFTRRLDARLGADGAIVTVCEAERGSARGALLSLLAERTLAGLDGARLARASSPPSPLSAAVFLAGLAFLAWIVDVQTRAGRAPLWEALTELEFSVQSGARSGSAELQRALDELEIARAASDLAATEERELERRLRSAMAKADSGGPGPADTRGEGAPPVGAGETGPGAEGAGGTEPGARRGVPGGSGQSTLAADAAVSTMSRPLSPDPMQTSTRTQRQPAPSSASGTEDGSNAGYSGPRGRFWPRRHDAVVLGYVELEPRD